jgi:hypothetical protein
MLQFSSQRFQIVRDTFEVSDPYGMGITFCLRRYGSKAHQKFLREQQKKSPIQRAAMRAWTEESLLRDGGSPAEVQEAVKKRTLELMKDDIDAGRLDVFEIVERFNDAQLDDAADLIDGWDGMLDASGNSVQHSAETVRELLSIDTVVISNEADYGHGLTLGEALVQFMLERSRKQDETRGLLVEAVEKNSEASAPGS